MDDIGNIRSYLMYFAVSAGLLMLFLTVSVAICRVEAWRSIQAGNSAAAAGVGGLAIGFALPLASATVHSDGLTNAAVAACLAGLVQLSCMAAFMAARRHAVAALIRGEVAEGIFLAAVSIAVGILNAAALS